MAYAKLPQPGSPLPISKISDSDLRRMGIEELIRLLRKTDSEKLKAIVEKGNIMKDVNQRMQRHLVEIREFKEFNQKLQDENQELRDLCCFLDDDRQKGRKLAKEWQRFGRYTSSVMKSEVSVYQDKLKELEKQQEELIKENLELKELCLYLDQDLKRHTRDSSIDRDQGDGSSNSSAGAGEKHEEPSLRTDDILHQRPVISEQTIQYIRKLEDKIILLEDEKKQLAQKIDRNDADGQRSLENQQRKYFSSPHIDSAGSKITENIGAPKTTSSLTGKPEAVAQAMKVLEVHEQLEMPEFREPEQTDINMDETEKALIRQMCNVVWKKLGEEVPGYTAARF